MPEISSRFSTSALRDLEEIRAWYADQGVPGIGERFIEQVFQRVQALADHPELGRIVPEFGDASLRELIQPPFRVVYRRRSRQISIVRVWRSERMMRPDSPPAAEV
ncbi:MAG: type II toxin-antitoxin system RelE/ParE family toxin [Wenzhouxiangellaceae bacterium]|nr:type II toxin-antitoxin system RelE/ParE family toxin [Wenzhouxiangellaceae bacterium]